MEDGEIVALYWQRDEAAIRETEKKYGALCRGVERELEDAELAAAIDRWLRTLPQADRVLFLRRYWYGMGLRALAARPGSFTPRLARRLRREMKAYQRLP